MAQVTPIERLRVVRPDDFLLLDFHFTNLGLEPGNKGEPQILVPFPRPNSYLPNGGASNGKPYISIEFQSQSAGEQVFPDQSKEPVTPAIPVRGEFAGASFVIFELPADFKSAPFTLEGLLKLCYKSADIPERGTAIEAPFRLLVQPSPNTGWKHAAAPVTHKGVTELWHTRLGVIKSNSGGVLVDEFDPKGRTLRAAGNLAWDPGVEPFRLPLEWDDRDAIHVLSAQTPAAVKRLMLSALGAWLDVNGVWPDRYGQKPPIEEWQHRMTLGRDHFVRTAEPGFLYPFGHRASLITVTERKFQDTHGERAAFLYQRTYIIVRQLSREYAPDDFPFKSLTILNPVTPALAPPDQSAVEDIGRVGEPVYFGKDAFYPRIFLDDRTITDFLFHLRGLDREEQTVDFVLPLLFVTAAKASAYRVTMALRYNEDEQANKRRNIVLGGQTVAFSNKTADGDAALDTETILVRAQAVNVEPYVRPKLEAALVRVPAVNQLSGKNDPVEIEIDYYPDQSNANGVFARVRNPAASLKVPTDRAGGLTAPEFSISGLSNRLGPIGGDVKAIADGHFEPKDFFKGLDPKILGGVSLIEILKGLDFS